LSKVSEDISRNSQHVEYTTNPKSILKRPILAVEDNSSDFPPPPKNMALELWTPTESTHERTNKSSSSTTTTEVENNQQTTCGLQSNSSASSAASSIVLNTDAPIASSIRQAPTDGNVIIRIFNILIINSEFFFNLHVDFKCEN